MRPTQFVGPDEQSGNMHLFSPDPFSDPFSFFFFGRGGEGERKGTPAEGSRPTGSRHKRVESERFKCFSYDDLVKRDKVNLDIFW